MVRDNHIRDERPERELGEQDDPTLTTRVGRSDGAAENSKPAETTDAEPSVATGGIVQQIWRRIKEERNRPKRVEINTRGQNNMTAARRFSFSARPSFCAALRFSRCSLPGARTLRRGLAG